MTKFKTIYDRLLLSIPKKDSYWDEPYGATNCQDLEEVSKILYCVTPSQAIEKYFKENNFDLLISHHIGGTSLPHLTFHTAFDFCEQGLSAFWAKTVGIKNPQFIEKNAGVYGPIDPISFEELCAKVEGACEEIIGIKESRKDIITSVAVCSGLGGVILSSVEKLAEQGLIDCYILGETTKAFKDTKIDAMIEMGHTKSERIGGNLIKEMLKDLQVEVHTAPLDIDVYGGEVHRPISFDRESFWGAYLLTPGEDSLSADEDYDKWLSDRDIPEDED